MEPIKKAIPIQATAQMQQQEHEQETEGLKVTLPHGITAQAKGPIALSVILVTVAVFTVFYFLKEHDRGTGEKFTVINTKMENIAEKMEEVGYILTLTEDQKKLLHLDMPESLRKKTRPFRDRERSTERGN